MQNHFEKRTTIMFWNKWLSWLNREPQLSGKRPNKRARSRCKLGFEVLENRLAPAVIAVVTNSADEYDVATPPPGLAPLIRSATT